MGNTYERVPPDQVSARASCPGENNTTEASIPDIFDDLEFIFQRGCRM